MAGACTHTLPPGQCAAVCAQPRVGVTHMFSLSPATMGIHSSRGVTVSPPFTP